MLRQVLGHPERPELEVRVSWRAFLLNPGMPAGGMDRRAYYAAKFGNEAGARLVTSRIVAAGLEEGIAFEFSAIERMPSSVDSHRLIALARDRGESQDDLVEALFRAYFLLGEDIGDPQVLADVGEVLGSELARGDGEEGLVHLVDVHVVDLVDADDVPVAAQ